MKKILTFVFALLLMFSVASCNKDDNSGENNNNNNQNQQTTVETDKTVSGFVVEATTKVYLTTIGQSDFDVVANLIAKTTRTDVVQDNLLTASQVEEGSVVFLVTGSSSKGLGSAGTDINAENVRAEAFAAAAKEGKFTVVVVHVGGEQRRGAQADPIIRTVTPAAKLVMVVETGNADGLFTTLAGSTIPCYSFSRATKMVDSFKAILG